MTPLTLEQSLKLLADLTGWFKADVDRDPDSAAWEASARVWEAKNVIRAAKEQKGSL